MPALAVLLALALAADRPVGVRSEPPGDGRRGRGDRLPVPAAAAGACRPATLPGGVLGRSSPAPVTIVLVGAPACPRSRGPACTPRSSSATCRSPPSSGPSTARWAATTPDAQRSARGREVWVPFDFVAKDEGYRFLLPGRRRARVPRGARDDARAEAVWRATRWSWSRLPAAGRRLPRRCTILGQRLDLRGRQSRGARSGRSSAGTSSSTSSSGSCWSRRPASSRSHRPAWGRAAGARRPMRGPADRRSLLVLVRPRGRLRRAGFRRARARPAPAPFEPRPVAAAARRGAALPRRRFVTTRPGTPRPRRLPRGAGRRARSRLLVLGQPRGRARRRDPHRRRSIPAGRPGARSGSWSDPHEHAAVALRATSGRSATRPRSARPTARCGCSTSPSRVGGWGGSSITVDHLARRRRDLGPGAAAGQLPLPQPQHHGEGRSRSSTPTARSACPSTRASSAASASCCAWTGRGAVDRPAAAERAPAPACSRSSW